MAATFTLSLNVPSGRSLSVDYATADVTATAPADYLAASGTLTFAPGETSKQVTVLVNGDLLDEANETFRVNLSNPVNATIADGAGHRHDHRRRPAGRDLRRRRERPRGQLRAS